MGNEINKVDSVSNIKSEVRHAKRVVVKVGTSTLTYSTGRMNYTCIDRLAMVLSDLQNQGKEVILVSSGAIGVGAERIGFDHKPVTVEEKQAAAAVGQSELMAIYSKRFAEYGHKVAQILLTPDNISGEESRKNVINTFEQLISLGIIPIVNENDSVAVEEIKAGLESAFNENDTLSANVAILTNADMLIILSDVDGFYDGDPREDKNSKIISIVKDMTEDLEEFAGGSGTERGTGGMVTKLRAARMVVEKGIHMVLASGDDPNILMSILAGNEVGSLFVGKKGKKKSAKTMW